MNTRRHFTQFYLFVALLSCLGFSACTETETEVFGSVYGSIYDAVTHDAIQTADVTINPGGKKTVTGSDGRFEYTNLEPGQYSLTITKNGYQTNSGKVTVIANEASLFELLLKPGESYLRILKTSLNYSTNNVIDAFDIENAGKSPLSWNIQSEADWISKIEPMEGTTEVNRKTPVSVTIDRSKFEKGKEYSAYIIVKSDSGSESIEIIAKGDEPGPNPPDPNPGSNINAGLMAHYTFDDENAKDITENKYHGSLVNDVNFTSETVSGKGKAIILNGVREQYMNIPYNLLKGQCNYTISMWVKDLSSGVLFAACGSSVKEAYPRMVANPDNKFKYNSSCIWAGDVVIDFVFSYSYTPLQNGEWHMVTVTCKSPSIDSEGTIGLYIDGVLVDSAYNRIGSSALNTKIQIGGNIEGGLGVMSSMKVDNVRLYSKTLSANDIEYMYNYEKNY